ncbi:ergothioneine biosynthesis protein EgtB [Spongiibacter marinus]|uniref:ergothioneine biosynthesis protein EgtB n=1 Tax=Spongiibacter marinus TaxID=354246 RepID=UPI003567B695
MLNHPTSDHGDLAEPLSLERRYQRCRDETLALVASLSDEDCQLQSMPDASPAKWHLAHSSWFFETFILQAQLPDYQPFHPSYAELFNSYYNAIGKQFSRPHRGLLSRPSLADITRYRAHVDRHIRALLRRPQHDPGPLLILGIQHEKQHQELLLMDIKHAFHQNPLYPAYQPNPTNTAASQHAALSWSWFDGGLVCIGDAGSEFSFDNERPQHKVWLNPFELANRPVSNGEFAEFIADGGYRRPEHWLSDGWAQLQDTGRGAPHYWHLRDDQWWEFTLAGLHPLQAASSACHLNFYEATAYAHWAGARLPTEQEWEHASRALPVAGHFANRARYHPEAAQHTPLAQMFGDVWEWTNSSYLPYPGFTPFAGDAGEYNGKFMSGQFVLRGGSCLSPDDHLRHSYRNFFYPHQYWQCAGLRLARDLT